MQKNEKSMLAAFQAAQKRFRILAVVNAVVYLVLAGLLGYAFWDVYTHLSPAEFAELRIVFFQRTVPFFLTAPALIFVPLYIVFYRKAREAYKHWLWSAPALLAFRESISAPVRIDFDVTQALYQVQMLERGFAYKTKLALHGIYRNMPITLLDIDSKVFCAQVIMLECRRIFKHRFSALESGFICRPMKRGKGPRLKSGDPEFDSHYACYAIDSQVDYLDMKQTEFAALNAIAAFPEIKCMFTFSGDRLYIGLQGNSGAYRPPLLRSFDNSTAHRRMTEFLEALLTVMDVFAIEQ